MSTQIDSPEITPETQAQAAEGSAQTQAPSASSSRYASLEEAERAASRFQSERDKANPFYQLRDLGTPDQIRSFISTMLPVMQRPDFKDFVNGVQSPADPMEDELLTPEQLKIRDLEMKLAAIERSGASQHEMLQRERVESQFERAEKVVDDLLGPAWTERRPEVLSQLQRLAQHGVADKINPSLLLKAYINSFEDVEQLKEAMTHHARRWEQARLSGQRGRETTIPTNVVPAGAPPKVPKHWADAWLLGMEDLKNGRAG